MREITDWRHIANGWEIPTEMYCDQPYVVKTDDGAWLCALTTGVNHEGQPGEHVVSLRSTDKGRTWSEPVDVEPATLPEAAYSVMVKVPAGFPAAGRVYIFYNHNTDNVREVIADPEYFPSGLFSRVDSLGHFVFKYSDEHGKSWSETRYDIPQRTMEIDRQNPYGGELKFFWNVGKAFILDGRVYVSLHKVGEYGAGGFAKSEGVLLMSENLLDETGPENATWETLPEGEIGLHTPPGGGPVAEEQSYVVLSDKAICAVYRTIDGYPGEAYSRDGGRSWSTPQHRHYADGRRIKHSRAANFHWKLENGKYVYWFHNHGGRFIAEHPDAPSMSYKGRNPVWFSAGVEVDTPESKIIQWSQPEIGLYHDDPYVGMSYPDLVEEDGQIYITETKKDVARTHLMQRELFEAMWAQFDVAEVAQEGLILELSTDDGPIPGITLMPPIPRFLKRDRGRADWCTQDLRRGFSIDVWFRLHACNAEQILVDNRSTDGHGFCLQTTSRCTVEIILNDGFTENRWECDRGVIEAGKLHHLVAIVDGGPKIISFVVDGMFNDGGEYREYGWGRYSRDLRDVNASVVTTFKPSPTQGNKERQSEVGATQMLRVGRGLSGEVCSVRIYDRYLLTSEAVGNYRAGRKQLKEKER